MLPRIVVCVVLSLAASFAQFPPAPSASPRFEPPRFEVVAIKPVPPPTPEQVLAGTGRPVFNVDGARVQIGGYSQLGLLMRAFRVEQRQLDASRISLGSEYFEIQATLPAGAMPEQVPEMLQAMLAERFKLAYHRETRDYQVNVLTVGKNGMKLPRLPDGTRPASTSDRLPDGSTRMTQTGNVASLFPVMNSFGGLQMVDETGLDGIYTWVRVQLPPTPGMSYQDVVQDAFQAMIEAAGLKLETRKVPKETIVVDHLEKNPTEN
jgi:uncharacterized protein (TIGR03435 family)